jgi:hypothetical protein
MKNISSIFLYSNATLEHALLVIDRVAVKIALVVDEENKLLRTLSDGGVRRGLLNKKSMGDTITDIYQKNPITIKKDAYKRIYYVYVR